MENVKEVVATEEEIKVESTEEVEVLDIEEPIGFTETDEEMTLENKEEE